MTGGARERLRDPGWEVRAAAIDALADAVRAGDEGLREAVALRLGDEVGAVRSRAWAALAPLGDPRILAAAAVRSWESADPVTVRDGLAAADTLLGSQATAHAMLRAMRAERVRDLARAADPLVRAAALLLLSRLRGPGDADLILGALADPDPGVRESALIALRAFDRPEDADAAERLVHDAEEEVRLEALTTVASLAGADAPALDHARVDPSPRVRRRADMLSGRPAPER